MQRQGDGQGDTGRGQGGEGEKQGGERRSGDGASAQEQQRGLLEGDRKDERGVDQQDGLRQKGAGVMDQQQMMVSLSFAGLISSVPYRILPHPTNNLEKYVLKDVSMC